MKKHWQCRRRVAGWAAVGWLAGCWLGGPAHAIRPFVTDDARVVGKGRVQLETWVHDEDSELIHTGLGAIGPTEWLEATVGFMQGGPYGPGGGYGLTGPLVQLKALLNPARSGGPPGLAVAAGVWPQLGKGPLAPEGEAPFAYMAATQNLYDEALLLHVNLGLASAVEYRRRMTTVTTGFGFQARAWGGLHAVGEVYYGDPYDPLAPQAESQIGFRYILSDQVQFDGTVGQSMTGADVKWWTLGIRLVSLELW